MRIVIADTNALIIPFKSSINLDSELRNILGDYKVIVPAPMIGELKRLEPQLPQARPALKLARTREIVETEASGDDAVIEAAERFGGIIMTNDKELIGKAKRRAIPVIRMVGGKRLSLTDHLSGDGR